ncbi:hypothetical protein M1271_02360 [Patescibacteria group bacterium]|nr:hypothetical protein [Patescibacteria group bacterium]
MFVDIAVYIISFIVIWFGAGLIVDGVGNLSHKLNISSFATSFFVLGILTSIPEASVGINSIINHTPDIFVGDLIGASLVLFILAIPILAIFGNGIKLSHQMTPHKLILSLFVVAAPVFLILDKTISSTEGLFLIFLYLALFYSVEKKKGILENIKDRILDGKTHFLEDVMKLTGGALLVFVSSKILVDKTIYFSGVLGIAPFLISLLVLSIGTNLPELSLAIRSVILGKKEVALGDYVGSAAANTLIFGVLTLINGGEVVVSNHYLQTLIFMVLGLGFFYYFSRSKNDISRKEGIVLLSLYFLFIFMEMGG